jgi:hypothetical protein
MGRGVIRLPVCTIGIVHYAPMTEKPSVPGAKIGNFLLSPIKRSTIISPENIPSGFTRFSRMKPAGSLLLILTRQIGWRMHGRFFKFAGTTKSIASWNVPDLVKAVTSGFSLKALSQHRWRDGSEVSC